MAIAALSYAGAAGLVIKGVSHSWDEIARMALKASGRELADDAVKSAAKTIEQAAEKYGDDVVVKLNAKVPGQVSRMVAAAEKSGVGGVEGAVRAVSNLPAEDVPRVLGAVEKNPSVACEFLEHVEKGGKYFVDKVFAVNAKWMRFRSYLFGRSHSICLLASTLREK